MVFNSSVHLLHPSSFSPSLSIFIFLFSILTIIHLHINKLTTQSKKLNPKKSSHRYHGVSFFSSRLPFFSGSNSSIWFHQLIIAFVDFCRSMNYCYNFFFLLNQIPYESMNFIISSSIFSFTSVIIVHCSKIINVSFNSINSNGC